MFMKKKGFTLIELLVVIAIISLLAAIAVPRLVDRIRRARMTKAEADIRQIETALGMLETDGGAPLSVLLTQNVSLLNMARRAYANDLLVRLNQTGLTYREEGSWMPLVSALLMDPQAFDPKYPWNTYRLWQPRVAENLSTSYMEKGITLDPWGDPYVIHVMPRNPQARALRWFDPNFGDPNIPGLAISSSIPVPRNMNYYIYSRGEDRTDNIGAYDDINNWDVDRGWVPAYSG